jgi:hypothetical protein
MKSTKRFYIDKAKKAVDKMFREARTIEDDEGIIKMETPIKLSITPKKESVESMHLKTVERLNKRKLLKYIACYIEDGKVIMEKI